MFQEISFLNSKIRFQFFKLRPFNILINRFLLNTIKHFLLAKFGYAPKVLFENSPTNRFLLNIVEDAPHPVLQLVDVVRLTVLEHEEQRFRQRRI